MGAVRIPCLSEASHSRREGAVTRRHSRRRLPSFATGLGIQFVAGTKEIIYFAFKRCSIERKLSRNEGIRLLADRQSTVATAAAIITMFLRSAMTFGVQLVAGMDKCNVFNRKVRFIYRGSPSHRSWGPWQIGS